MFICQKIQQQHLEYLAGQLEFVKRQNPESLHCSPEHTVPRSGNTQSSEPLLPNIPGSPWPPNGPCYPNHNHHHQDSQSIERQSTANTVAIREQPRTHENLDATEGVSRSYSKLGQLARAPHTFPLPGSLRAAYLASVSRGCLGSSRSSPLFLAPPSLVLSETRCPGRTRERRPACSQSHPEEIVEGIIVSRCGLVLRCGSVIFWRGLWAYAWVIGDLWGCCVDVLRICVWPENSCILVSIVTFFVGSRAMNKGPSGKSGIFIFVVLLKYYNIANNVHSWRIKKMFPITLTMATQICEWSYNPI